MSCGGRILIPGRKSFNYAINISLREAARGINNVKSLVISGARGVYVCRAARESVHASLTPRSGSPIHALGRNEYICKISLLAFLVFLSGFDRTACFDLLAGFAPTYVARPAGSASEKCHFARTAAESVFRNVQVARLVILSRNSH